MPLTRVELEARISELRETKRSYEAYFDVGGYQHTCASLAAAERELAILIENEKAADTNTCVRLALCICKGSCVRNEGHFCADYTPPINKLAALMPTRTLEGK